MCAETISCPKCGASVDFPIGQEKTTCAYCHSIITKPIAGVSSLQRIQEAQIYVRRGWNSILSGRQALSFFNKAIELDPDNVKAWSGKGVALLYSIGVIRARQISEIPPEHMKEAEEALKCLQKACEIGGELNFDLAECDTLTWRQALALRLGKWNEIYEGRYKSGY